MHASIFGFRCHKFPVPERLHLTRHGCFHWKFQLFPCVFNGFLERSVIRINRRDASQLSRIVEPRFPRSRLAAFLFVELLLTFRTKFLATDDQALWLQLMA